MYLRATAKINLSLDVVGKREDGYHEVRMIMQKVGMYDRLMLEAVRGGHGISLTTNLSYIPTDENNLVVKAARLLMEEAGVDDGLRIRLDKFIPVAAGLAGGSADAAMTMIGVNRLFSLGLTEAQLMEREGRLPDVVMACVGGGSNAMGTFYDFIKDESVKLIGCEAAGEGVDTPRNAATIANGKLGVFHGMKSLFCQNEYGQIDEVYSISAGLDYPGIGPEHAMLNETGRAQYVSITDEEAVSAFEYLSRVEGIIPAIESSHAVAYARKLAPTMSKDQIMVVTVSGRGDKDVAAIARYRGVKIFD